MPSASPPPTRAGALPRPPHDLVGRRADLERVEAALVTAPVVTVVGPGGSGKTRLAVEVARRVDQRQPALVHWVGLERARDPAAVPRAVANALGVRETVGRALAATLADRLGDQAVVLVVDNCEHLLASCRELVATLVGRCPRLRVLATSREPLGVPGELLVPLGPLAVPPSGPCPGAAPADVVGLEAVQLFRERARAVVPTFVVTDDNAEAVSRICRDLDGLPLAIELAAARVRVLTPEEIADSLGDRLALLVGGPAAGSDRHRTLRATLDWSHRLLDDVDRDLFARLSVFVGGFTLEAAAAVSGDSGGDRVAVLHRVAALVDRSLLTTTALHGGTRYAMLETVRLYAAEHLAVDAAAALDVPRRHAAWMLDLAVRGGEQIAGPDPGAWLDQLEADRGNLNAALHWQLGAGGDPVQGLRTVTALARFCRVRGYYSEGRAWLRAALAAAPDAPSPLRTEALAAAGTLAHLQCDYEVARSLLEEALAEHRVRGDDAGVAAVVQSLGSVARERGDYETARRLHGEARRLSERLGDPRGVAQSANHLAMVAWLERDLDTATALAEAALAGYRALRDDVGVCEVLVNLGAAALHGGRSERATALLQESLLLARRAGHREGVAWSLHLLGLLGDEPERSADLLRESLQEHWSLGDRWRGASVLEAIAAGLVRTRPERAARLLGGAAALREAIGAPVPPVEKASVSATRDALRARLDADDLDDLEQLGRLAGPDAAVADALRPGARFDARFGLAHATVEVPAAAPAAAGAALSRPGGVESLAVLTLGDCRIVVGGRAVRAGEFGYAKPRELLCFLLDRGEASKDQIGAALWPWASPAGLRSSFHTSLRHLRAVVGADRVRFSHGRYGIAGGSLDYDVERFEAALTRAQDADPEARTAALAEAVAAYGGDFLGDLPGESWIEDRRRQLRRSFERALAELGRRHAEAGRWPEAIEVLERAVAEDPWAESTHRELMRSHLAAGEPAAAIRQFHRLTDLLQAELGTAPTAETAELYRQILEGGRIRRTPRLA